VTVTSWLPFVQEIRTLPVRSPTSVFAVALKRAMPGPVEDRFEVNEMNAELDSADHSHPAGLPPVMLTVTSKLPPLAESGRVVGVTV
jgi:hypothetical protein